MLTMACTGGAHRPGCHHPCRNWLTILQKALAKQRPLRPQKAEVIEFEFKVLITTT